LLLLASIDYAAVARLLAGYGMELCMLGALEPIQGSYWGESEAGLRGNTLYARHDTPLHSVLHETAHYICMSPERRAALDRDAGGDDAEESAVCYLQLLLADALERIGRERLFADMDAWGYSFRLGGTKLWFESDADDALSWLRRHGIADPQARLTGALRRD
jgi:hypothetical protein